MIFYDKNSIRQKGDEIGEIIWQGRQWAVTKDGLEARDGGYFIAADRLTETFDSGEPSWLMHMGEKTWLDHDDFATAFFVALGVHKNGKFDLQMIEKAIKGLNVYRSGA